MKRSVTVKLRAKCRDDEWSENYGPTMEYFCKLADIISPEERISVLEEWKSHLVYEIEKAKIAAEVRYFIAKHRKAPTFDEFIGICASLDLEETCLDGACLTADVEGDFGDISFEPFSTLHELNDKQKLECLRRNGWISEADRLEAIIAKRTEELGVLIKFDPSRSGEVR